MKRKTIIILVLTCIISLSLLYFLTDRTEAPVWPRTANLWTVGRYEMPQALWESGILKVDAYITNPAGLESGIHFNFELNEDYRYFIIRVFHCTTGLAHILNIALSNGEGFSMNFQFPQEEGVSHIIHAAEAWPEGEHSVSLYAWEMNINPYLHTGKAHVQVMAASSLEAVTEGLLPPPLDSLMTMRIVDERVGAKGATFLFENNSEHLIFQNHNYFIEKKQNDEWERLHWDARFNKEVWGGFITIRLETGESQIHEISWESLGELPPGFYRIILPRMIWRWENEKGMVFQQTIPLYIEFVIG